MSRPVAKQGDRVVAMDTHLVIPETGGAPVVVQIPFDGALDTNLSADVIAEHRPIALLDSVATQTPGHVVAPKSFVKPPSNRARVVIGAPTVLANQRPVARAGDLAETCNDPEDLPVGTIVASGTVLSG
jgi:uncharacterized Zn-binding protein involved in type VI secretion